MYRFINLLSTIREKRLIPLPNCPTIVINYTNAFTRVN